MVRSIVHFDADAFFASVEQAADRHLRGRPIVVGGLHRGIVASASYEARQFGIYTPMPIGQARRLCPNVIVVPVHFDLYEQFSANIFGLADEMTPLVERQGVDEGYLDLTGARGYLKRDPDVLAEKLQKDVKDWLKVTLSVGLARTKLLSQIASKLNKPDRFTLIPAELKEELAFLHPLPVKWLPGVGQTGEQLFQSAGITRIAQVAQMPVQWLAELFGSTARQLHNFAMNRDDRPVLSTPPDALSYGHQETFAEDTTDYALVEATARKLADQAFVRAREDRKQIRTVSLKLRYTDMDENQGRLSLREPTDVEADVYPLLTRLLQRLWDRRVRIRMVQVKLSNVYSGFSQLDLFGVKQRQRELATLCQSIRERFGKRAMMRAHDWVLNEDSQSTPYVFSSD